ncbi:hypothetical protein Nepgr_007958 [Nepenthes gracilis]|uniref:Uncharacterized protein n=1 Tax=Nepenthes gracilis TaxID=150966 RepID=A0AAD3XIS9_NEPGR|nr:hypothetical protein Nepgr_007958 [Nepenthes gracilis]
MPLQLRQIHQVLALLQLSKQDNAIHSLHEATIGKPANGILNAKSDESRCGRRNLPDPIRVHEMPKRIATGSQNKKGNGQVIDQSQSSHQIPTPAYI